MPIVWSSLRRPASPNTYLVAPHGFTPAPTDSAAPVFQMPAAALRERWTAMVNQQSRVERKAVSADGWQIDYIQRTPLMQFPDWITVRIIPAGETASTLAVYSRSVYGYGDLGTNKRRVQAWLDAL